MFWQTEATSATPDHHVKLSKGYSWSNVQTEESGITMISCYTKLLKILPYCSISCATAHCTGSAGGNKVETASSTRGLDQNLPLMALASLIRLSSVAFNS